MDAHDQMGDIRVTKIEERKGKMGSERGNPSSILQLPSSNFHPPSSTFHLPMSSPDITAAEIEAVNRVLQTPYLSLGPRIAKFEERFAAYIGAHHAIGVSSGTAGLHLCVIAAGVSQGDLVITTPFSFIASANCILYERAIPVFVDIET